MRCLPQNSVTQIREQIQALLEKAKHLDAEDLKLADTSKKLFKIGKVSANNKVMIFSSFRHTLFYLHKHLIGRRFSRRADSRW